MRVIQVVPSIGEEASGPSYSVPRLTGALEARGVTSTLMTVGEGASPSTAVADHRRFRHEVRSPQIARTLWISGRLRRALDEEARTASLIHMHGLWAMPNVYPAGAARRANIPLIASPRGTLGATPLSYSKWRKRIFWALIQGPAVRRAAALHATCDAEYEEIRDFGLKQPVIVVPNGVDLPPDAPRFASSGPRRALFLSRLHPKKGIEMLLDAWSQLCPRFPAWELRIAGPGQADYVRELKQRAARLGLDRVIFIGPVYGEDKQREYRSAELFVLPSFNENFGMAVAEALSFGTPVVTTTGTPWSGLRDRGCGWWTEPDPDALESALAQALACDEQALIRMGASGRAWMAEEFSWDRVAADMEAAYRWILGRGERPETVRIT